MTEKKSAEPFAGLQDELAAANKAAQDVLRENAVQQGLHDGEKDSAQNDDSKNAAESNDDDNVEHFEQIREDRLKQAEKDAKKDAKV